MKKDILIATFDMEVGGVERSLINMLNHFNYDENAVDLMLYSHTGDFMDLLPKQIHLLDESNVYKTFRMSIKQIMKTGKIHVGMARLISKYKASRNHSTENGYKQMQYMWKYALPFLPKHVKQYDVAISYLWPHYFVADKVEAKTKIAWIHTDYSTIATDTAIDVAMWTKFDTIVAVSEACKQAFLQKYPNLTGKVIVMENIASPETVRRLAGEVIVNQMEDDRRFKLLTVARLSHAKGIDRAIKSLRLLRDRGHDFTWYVVGYGGDEAMLRKLIEANDLLDHFILLGKKTNPYPYMKATDLYVQPSRYEGKAVTVGEAQMLAKPVLITNYPTATSQVRDGVDGVICAQSVEGIANGIEKLYHDVELRNRLADNCKRSDYRNAGELKKLYELI